MFNINGRIRYGCDRYHQDIVVVCARVSAAWSMSENHAMAVRARSGTIFFDIVTNIPTYCTCVRTVCARLCVCRTHFANKESVCDSQRTVRGRGCNASYRLSLSLSGLLYFSFTHDSFIPSFIFMCMFYVSWLLGQSERNDLCTYLKCMERNALQRTSDHD